MAISEPDFNAFKAYVNECAGFKERECQPYLVHAVDFLLPQSPSQITDYNEERNYFGETDVIISADIRSDTNSTARHAFIWELKAPQCYLFEMETQTRCRPTDAFLRGENQLLHYFHEASGNGRFRQRMEVIDEDNIHIGGLIIGTRERMLRGSDAVDKADAALRMREKYFYKSNGLRVLTWDRILDFVRPS